MCRCRSGSIDELSSGALGGSWEALLLRHFRGVKKPLVEICMRRLIMTPGPGVFLFMSGNLGSIEISFKFQAEIMFKDCGS